MADEPNEVPNQAPKKSGVLGDLVKAESMIQLALALPAGCLIGWLIGSWLDGHFHQSWISIAGIILGAIAGFVQIFVTASRFLKSDRSNPQ
ncbi:MAG: AtpZ/AtpI family protein [Edaphobacter sp.]